MELLSIAIITAFTTIRFILVFLYICLYFRFFYNLNFFLWFILLIQISFNGFYILFKSR